MASRRYLSIWLRRLPTDRITRAHKRDDARPLVVTADIKSARRLVELNDAAAHLGLYAGMALADARAMFPDIDIVESDSRADHTLLEGIADWCDRYTPLIGLDAPDGLALDIAGCAHLFGGEAALLRDIVRRLNANGLRARGAITGTFSGAWALARYGKRDLNIVASGALPEALPPLPLAALRLEPKTVAALSELGLKKIADLIARPRAPLAARFGVSLLRRLDQALGDEAESISPRLPPPSYVVEQRFAEPIALERDILSTIEHLARRLSPLLERRGEGARQFELAVFRVDGCVRRMSVSTSRPSRDPILVHRLFADKIVAFRDAHDPGFGFDLVRLSVTHAERSDPVAIGFDEPDHAAEIAQLIDRLGARFGLDRVARLEVNDTHIPEYAVVAHPASASVSWPGLSRPSTSSLPKLEDVDARPKAGHDKGSSDPPRPVRLFEKPERIEAIAQVPDGPPVRFRWRRVLHHIAHAEGPERIAMEWWRNDAGRALTRDYFRVENAQGARFWIFRDGLYERETTQPRWFLHGVLA